MHRLLLQHKLFQQFSCESVCFCLKRILAGNIYRNLSVTKSLEGPARWVGKRATEPDAYATSGAHFQKFSCEDFCFC